MRKDSHQPYGCDSPNRHYEASDDRIEVTATPDFLRTPSHMDVVPKIRPREKRFTHNLSATQYQGTIT
jgi:hypothetical protein